jgi:hypothetical protein
MLCLGGFDLSSRAFGQATVQGLQTEEAGVDDYEEVGQDDPDQGAQGMMQGAYMSPAMRQVYLTDAYTSPKLRAKLKLERMQIPGYTFWGARIVGMDHRSPLRRTNLQLGDVITRMDGVSIADGKYWTGQYWWLPQAERHYGRTQLRVVRAGGQQAENVNVDLGSPYFPSFGPSVPLAP